MRRTPRPHRAATGACLLVLAVAGCASPSGEGGGSAAGPLPSASAGPSITTVVSTTPDATDRPPTTQSPPARRTTPPPARPATSLPSSPKNQQPVVRSVRAVPDHVDPLACTPPTPAERPLVIADVYDPDDPTTSLTVRLDYSADVDHFQGDVRMAYDPSRRAFVYRLPPVTADAVGRRTESIWLYVTARDWDIHALNRPPVLAIIRFESYCLITPAVGSTPP